jgi:phosphoribosylaminoimidazole-succinocarboxamide synthase
MDALYETKLDLPLLSRGKVRDVYTIDGALLMIATDRLSAFDVVFKEPIPRKGDVLNSLSLFWFDKTKHIINNHFLSSDIPKNLKISGKRAMIVQRTTPVRLECVV